MPPPPPPIQPDSAAPPHATSEQSVGDLLRLLGTKEVMDNHDLYVAPPAVETILQEPGAGTNPDWAGMVRRSATQAP